MRSIHLMTALVPLSFLCSYIHSADASEGGVESGAASQASPNEQSQRKGERRGIEEVVVTAQKRGAERLQDVPISISVLGGIDLDHSNLSMADTLQTVPGVTIRESVQAGGTIVTIRGTPVAGATGNGSSPVAYYLDTVPFGFVRHAISPDANV